MVESRPTGEIAHVFVGRQQEMAVLETAFSDAISGHGRMVMLAGEPGIGKTRTAQELASHAESLGTRVLWGWCYEREGAPPYWPWVQPIQSYVLETLTDQLLAEMGPGASDIAELIPEIRKKIPDLELSPALEPQQTRFRLFNSISTFIKNLAQSQAMVLVLDDLHWADTPSLLLLEFLARQMAESRILVIGTYRDIEISRQHPLSESLAQLSRSPVFLRLVLGGLQSKDVGPFIRAAGGENASLELINAIYAQTEGNPLFMSEVIRLLGDQDDLAASEGATAPVALGLPQGVREAIGQRLNRLSAECVGVLTTASVIGRQFDFNLLNMLTEETTEFRLLELVEEALESYIIEELPVQTDRYQFSHALMQQTLLEGLSTSRKVRLHARIGEVLETLYGDDPGDHAAELAYHFAEASPVTGPEKLVWYSLMAGEGALAIYSYEQALDHFQRGLEAKAVPLSGTGPANDAESAALLFGLGRAQWATLPARDYGEALASAKRAFDYYVEVGDTDRAVDVVESAPRSTAGYRMGEAQLFAQALELVPNESNAAGRLLSRYGRVMGIVEGDYAAAQEAFGRALVIAKREKNADLEMWTLVYAATLNVYHRHYQQTLEESLRAIELARRADDSYAEVDARFWCSFALMVSGDLEGMQLHSSAMLTVAEKLGHRNWLTSALNRHEVLSQLRGEWLSSRGYSERGLSISPQEPRHLGSRVLLEYQAGDFAQGREYLERLIEAMRKAPAEATMSFVVPAVVLPLVARIAETDDHLDISEEAAQVILSSRSATPLYAMTAKCGLALIAVRKSDVTAATELYRDLESQRGTLLWFGSIALDRVLGLLAQTMAQLDTAADHFEDALAFCRRAGYRPELAWICHDYADTLLERNNSEDRDKATSLLDEALDIAQELGMRPLVERVLTLQEQSRSRPSRAPVYPGGLSQREVEVLRLISAGKTDREIAEELFISPLTVGNHVKNILNKTTTSNRTEAATYAVREGLV